MVSHEHKVIFVHIPKTAGESIALYFLELLSLKKRDKASLLIFHDKRRTGTWQNIGHLRTQEYLDLKFVSEEQYRTYFKFSFVRNPWDRVVSFYKYLSYNRIVSFESFVRYVLPDLISDSYFFVQPQSDFIVDMEGNLLVDFLGRFESLTEDMRTVKTRLGLPQTELGHTNKTLQKKGLKYLLVDYYKIKRNPGLLRYLGKDRIKSRDYRDYYSKKLVDSVRVLYQTDIDHFEYNFEND